MKNTGIVPIVTKCAVLCAVWIIVACGETTFNEYVCNNGTAKPGETTAQNVEQCEACNDGYHLEGTLCQASAYTCENGTPASGSPAANGEARCANCNDGYSLEEFACVATCENGTATVEKGTVICRECNGGYHKFEGACVVNVYTCANGTPVTEIVPDGVHEEARCASCDAGYGVNRALVCAPDIDTDRDGLIDISTLEELHNMRYNLKGTSYKTSASDTGGTGGAPTAPTANCPTATDDGVYLCGYELMNDLDFDVDGDGTYSGTLPNIMPDADDNDNSPNNNDPYFVADSGGWKPIGFGTGISADNRFSAIFDGNGFTIANLTANSRLDEIGLFGVTGAGARIRNVGMVNVRLVYDNRNAGSVNYVGGLVGFQAGGSITASYATGAVHGGANANTSIGGLAGQSSGTITASYASVTTNGGSGDDDYTNSVGGLVGYMLTGSIVASYATGDIDGRGGISDAGGLVGYAGKVSDAAIKASITASYATGTVDGGTNTYSTAGSLVGLKSTGVTITASYGFETATGTLSVIDPLLPSGATAATGLTIDNAGSCSLSTPTHKTRSACTGDSSAGVWTDWNGQTGGLNAWIFASDSDGSCAAPAMPTDGVDYPALTTRGTCEATMNPVKVAGVWTAAFAPKLRYADYDGNGTVFACSQFPATLPDGTGTTPLTCGTTELRGQ